MHVFQTYDRQSFGLFNPFTKNVVCSNYSDNPNADLTNAAMVTAGSWLSLNIVTRLSRPKIGLLALGAGLTTELVKMRYNSVRKEFGEKRMGLAFSKIVRGGPTDVKVSIPDPGAASVSVFILSEDYDPRFAISDKYTPVPTENSYVEFSRLPQPISPSADVLIGIFDRKTGRLNNSFDLNLHDVCVEAHYPRPHFGKILASFFGLISPSDL